MRLRALHLIMKIEYCLLDLFYKIKNPKSLEKIEIKDSSIVLELYPNSTTKFTQAIMEAGDIGLKVLRLMEPFFILQN